MIAIFFSAVPVAVVLDQLTKHWASGTLARNSIEIVPGWFSLALHRNTGVAFSLPLEGLLLKLVTVVFILAIVVHYWRTDRHKASPLLHAGYGMLVWGALANAYDRIVSGGVVDFLALRYFAVFNVADIFISVGALCILIAFSHVGRTSSRS